MKRTHSFEGLGFRQNFVFKQNKNVRLGMRRCCLETCDLGQVGMTLQKSSLGGHWTS